MIQQVKAAQTLSHALSALHDGEPSASGARGCIPCRSRNIEGPMEGPKAKAHGLDSLSPSVSRADARHREEGRVGSVS